MFSLYLIRQSEPQASRDPLDHELGGFLRRSLILLPKSCPMAHGTQDQDPLEDPFTQILGVKSRYQYCVAQDRQQQGDIAHWSQSSATTRTYLDERVGRYLLPSLAYPFERVGGRRWMEERTATLLISRVRSNSLPIEHKAKQGIARIFTNGTTASVMSDNLMLTEDESTPYTQPA